MRLVLLNPNTTETMTERMAQAAQNVVNTDTQIIAVTAPYGPPSIEGYYDEVFCVPAMVEALQTLEEDYDGVVVGCFDDTGVDALRTFLDVPVVGICQAAMHTASLLSCNFAIVTTLPRSIPPLDHLVSKYGFASQCRKVRAADVAVLDLENDLASLRAIEETIALALEEDAAEAIVLGCAGMTDLTQQLSAKFSVPVIDGVTAAVKTVESLHSLGHKTSKRRGYAQPVSKTYKGEFSKFSPS